MSSVLTECEMQCLAWAVVSGESVKSWAETHGVDVNLARETSRLPVFEQLAAAHRLRLANRTAAMLSSLSPSAIDQLLELSRRSSSAADQRSAERARLKKRRAGSRRDGTAKRIANLEKRLCLRKDAAHAD
jgi:hypothetical protein